MSLTFLLSGRSHLLVSTFSPPIVLDQPHVIGLVDFVCYNSIPNIDARNAGFYYKKPGSKEWQRFFLPVGTYELDGINEALREKLGNENITLKANNSTLKCEIVSTYDIDFSSPGSIGPLLGFGPHVLQAATKHVSDLPVNITKINMVSVECNIATGSFVNGTRAHTIYGFSIDVSPGYKMILSPRTVIYSPVTTQLIERLEINIVDQDGNPIDFGGEEVTIRLHLKPENG